MTAVFFESSADRHALLIGGVTAIERRVREVAKQGATRAIVAAAPVTFPRKLPIDVEFVAPGSEPPEGARRERADVIAGIELVDAAAQRAAEWKLIRGSNKSYEGPVDALINWRISMRITRWLSRRSLAVTPNHVTACAILVGIFASAVASGIVGVSGWAQFALAGVLLQANSILDSVDGELARLRFQYSKVGQWMDNLSDDIVDNLFVASVGYALGGVWMWIGVGAAIGRVVVSITTYVSVYARTGTGDVFAFRWWFEGQSTSTDEVYDPKKLSTWFRSFGRRDTFVFIWMLAGIAAVPWWIVGHGGAIAATYVTLLVLHFTVFRSRR